LCRSVILIYFHSTNGISSHGIPLEGDWLHLRTFCVCAAKVPLG
jgi:hypothetical protein